MALPIRKPSLPSTVATAQNGMIPANLLSAVSPGRLMEATLCAPAMVALERCVLARFGWQLGTTGDYRTLQAQWNGFGGGSARYEPCTYEQYVQRRQEDKAARRKNTTKVWPTARRNEVIALLGPQKYPIPDETYWRLINPRSLNSAVPGTSNHGKGGSRDIAKIVRRFLRFWRRTAVALSAVEREQLTSVIVDYGFAWETLNDLPHITWFLGDQQAPALENDDMAYFVHVPGDAAEFRVTGDIARWITGQQKKAITPITIEEAVPVERLAYSLLELHGPQPDYSTIAGYQGQRTVAADFARWVP